VSAPIGVDRFVIRATRERGVGVPSSRSLATTSREANPVYGGCLRMGMAPSIDSGIVAEMDARSKPGLKDPFEEAIDDALSFLPADLRAAMSNVEIVVEDEPPDGRPLLGLYRGVPLPRRSSTYSGVLPDKISIFRGPITRLAAGDADRLGREVRHVVLHEIAHHFGISDERLIELDRY
jgi:predicted Zn-dependent protease with MMP-like domain